MNSQFIEILDYTLRRYYIDNFYTCKIAQLSPSTRVLDIGGNKIAKRGKFNIEKYDVQVIYLNLSPDKSPDIVADATDIPVQENFIETVICAEVLEHVPDPMLVLKEIQRILIPGGVVLISVPFSNGFHDDPYDYGRYTERYWRENLSKLGFTDISIEKQGLFWSVIADMLRQLVAYHMHKKRSIKNQYLRRAIYQIMKKVKEKAIMWDSRTENYQHPVYSCFTTGFGITAKKEGGLKI